MIYAKLLLCIVGAFLTGFGGILLGTAASTPAATMQTRVAVFRLSRMMIVFGAALVIVQLALPQ